MPRLRILIADDHAIVRRGLRGLLEEHHGWEVCAEVTTGREAVQKVQELKPDVAVLDIGMPDLNGLEATRQILKLAPKTEVLILTMHHSEEVVREVLHAGARGYVLKSDADVDLVAAVDALSKHRPFLTSRITDMVLDSYLEGGGGRIPEEVSTATRLTPREREIVQLVTEGKSNKEVATALGITVKTAETHRANIMHKLGLTSVTELVHYAIRNKIVEA